MNGEVDAALVEVLAAHLEPWWRCVHWQPPIGSVWTIGECRQCEAERDDVGTALAAVLAPYVEQRVAEAVRDGEISALAECTDLYCQADKDLIAGWVKTMRRVRDEAKR